MDNYTAVSIAEGFCGWEPSEEEQIEAWQHLLDTGLCWKLQGWFGRTALYLVSEGIIKGNDTTDRLLEQLADL